MIGVMKGDSRSSDYSSYQAMVRTSDFRSVSAFRVYNRRTPTL